MKIVTFNLRCDNNYDKENRWHFRKGLVLDWFNEEKPDIVGCQEVLPVMADFLKRYLGEYEFVGCGRGENYTGENNMIGYRKDKFEMMSLETFWLSPTPEVPGSRYEKQSSCPRVCTHVVLRPLGTCDLFHFYNTHLDHEADEARVLGATAIITRVKEELKRRDLPLIITGDMNAEPESGAIATFLNDQELGLVNQTPGFIASYHDFGRQMEHPQIDYIFTRGFEATRKSEAFGLTQYEGKYLSDHNALCAHLEMAER